MMCFIHIGHAQFNPFDTSLEITNMSMTPLGNRQVLVEYDVTGPMNSVTKITANSTGFVSPTLPTPLYTEVIDRSIIQPNHVSIIVTVLGKSNEVYLGCEVCLEDYTACHRDGCVVIVSDE